MEWRAAAQCHLPAAGVAAGHVVVVVEDIPLERAVVKVAHDCGVLAVPPLVAEQPHPHAHVATAIEAQLAVGVDFAIEQCRELISEGVPGIHFYALNRSQACARILDALGHGASPELPGER